MASLSSIRQEIHDLGGLLYDSATIGTNPLTYPEFASRSAHLPTRTQRLAVRGLVFALQHGRQPQLERLAARAYKGEQVLGLGHHSVVLAYGESRVRKVLHRTHVMPHNEQLEHIATIEKQQSMLAETFGNKLFAQQFTIEPFPPNPARSCVNAYQERVTDGVPSNMLKPGKITLDYLAECRNLYDETGVIPDIVGVGNTFETPNGIAIVDTIPFSAHNPAHADALLLAHKILTMHGLGKGLATQ